MNEGNSLINLGELSKPATVLIEKIAEATGGIFRPFQIRRVAQAEADAEIIKASAKIGVADLERRALHRFIHEEAKKQHNIESITQKALPAIEEKAQPEKIEDDWITNFFDKCRLISDEQMQILWSKVLAGEANAPGKFSKRTVNLLSSLDKTDAELFRTVCSFIWYLDGEPFPLIYGVLHGTSDFYIKAGLNHQRLRHLETISLIGYEANMNMIGKSNLPEFIELTDRYSKIEIKFPNKENNILDVGLVRLTQPGKEMALLIDYKPHEGFKEFLLHRWRNTYQVKEK